MTWGMRDADSGNSHDRARDSVWLKWIILTTVGLTAGLIGGFALGAPVEALVGMMLLTPVIMGIAGTVLGSAQWLLIRQRLPAAGWWIVHSAIGLGLGMTIGIVAVEQVGGLIAGEPVRLVTVGILGRVAGLAVVGGVAGVFLGAAQWLGLRRHSSRAGKWVLKNAVGLAVGFVLGSLFADLVLGGVGTPFGFIAVLVTGGLTAGILTAGAIPQIAPRTATAE